MRDREAGRIVPHAVFGPPNPALVLTVRVVVDRDDEEVFIGHLTRAVETAACPARSREHFGSRRLSSFIVFDLRRSILFSSAIFTRLSRYRDPRGGRLRLVLATDSALAGQIVVLGLTDSFDLYEDLATALLV